MTASEKTGTSAAAISAFLVGVSIGTVLGVLFAPRGGQETREQIRQKAQTARNKVQAVQQEKDMASDAVDSAKQAISEGKKALANHG